MTVYQMHSYHHFRNELILAPLSNANGRKSRLWKWRMTINIMFVNIIRIHSIGSSNFGQYFNDLSFNTLVALGQNVKYLYKCLLRLIYEMTVDRCQSNYVNYIDGIWQVYSNTKGVRNSFYWWHLDIKLNWK